MPAPSPAAKPTINVATVIHPLVVPFVIMILSSSVVSLFSMPSIGIGLLLFCLLSHAVLSRGINSSGISILGSRQRLQRAARSPLYRPLTMRMKREYRRLPQLGQIGPSKSRSIGNFFIVSSGCLSASLLASGGSFSLIARASDTEVNPTM